MNMLVLAGGGGNIFHTPPPGPVLEILGKARPLHTPLTTLSEMDYTVQLEYNTWK